jgi:hypothetical protein
MPGAILFLFLGLWLLGGAARALGFSGLRLASTIAVVLSVMITLIALTRGQSLPVARLLLAGALVVPFWVVGPLPHWLAWRVCGPLGLVRLGRLALFFAYFKRPLDRRGARELLAVAWGRRPEALDAACPSVWAMFALPLREERTGHRERAELFVRALLDLPQEARVPRRLRVIGGERLLAAAARRGDWPTVRRLAPLARGRGAWLLQLLARHRLEQPVPAAGLWLAWALAPLRLSTWRWVAAPPAPQEPVEVVGPPASTPWGLHLRLLSEAAAGRPVPLPEVARLARAWDGVLRPRDRARFIARGLTLGALSPADAWESFRGGLASELGALIASAEGSWPQGEELEGLTGEILRGRRDRLFAEVEAGCAGFPPAGGVTRELGRPLEEWEKWLRLRRAVDELRAFCGPQAVATAWHNGLRYAACNWPVFLQRAQDASILWMTWVMHRWSADQARAVGDAEIEGLSVGNAAGAKKSDP